jgi:hypothetical protein
LLAQAKLPLEWNETSSNVAEQVRRLAQNLMDRSPAVAHRQVERTANAPALSKIEPHSSNRIV